MPTPHVAIEKVLGRQKQLLTPSQVKREGAHGSTLARLVRAGELELVEAGVYGRVGVPMDWRRRLLAVILSAGPPAVASHRAAAHLLGLPSHPVAPLEITVPSKRTFTHPEAIVHQSRDLPYIPPVVVDGIPCTPPRRLAVDIGAVLGSVASTTVLRDIRRHHGVSWKQLAAVLELHSRRGRNGCGELRRNVERYAGLDGIPDSTLEQLLLDALIDAGLPLPVCQHEVPSGGDRPYRIDFAYVSLLLAIEVDGPHHRHPEVRARDRRRDAHLRRLGWDVRRFDEEAVIYAPWAVLDEIRAELRRRGAL